MEMILNFIFRILEFFSAGAPVICIILDMKNDNISSKHALLRLFAFLLVNVYYFLKIKDLFVIIYHIIPIVSAYVYWYFAVKERKLFELKNDSEHDLSMKSKVDINNEDNN